MEEWTKDRQSQRLSSLIDEATTSPAKELDVALLKSIKNLVRSSDHNVHSAVHLLMDRLKKNHSQVRYLCVLIIDELFSRSKLFRSLLVPMFDSYLLLSVGFRADQPLPPPSDRASLLRAKSIELLEKWNHTFGLHYRQLRLGYDYLKNTLRLQFPNLRETAASAEQERREREARSQQILRKKFQTLKDNFPASKAEIQLTMDEIKECFEILSVKTDRQEIGGRDDGSEDESEEYGSLTLRQIRDEAMLEEKTPRETGDNRAVFDVLRELYKVLTTKHIPAIQEWLSLLMRVDLPDNKVSDSLLKDVIDLRNQLQSMREKCEGLGCKPATEGKDEDEVMWEEGAVEASGPKENLAGTMQGVSDAAREGSKEGNFKPDDRMKSIEAKGSEAALLKQTLLEQAPVLPWGSFIDTWESKSAVPANPRGLELESHWGRVDFDAVIPLERAAEFNVCATYYKAEQCEIRPCLAPLRKGGLCQRRDLRLCPLHGPIIPRDDHGNPLEEKPDLEATFQQQETPSVGETNLNNGKRKSNTLTCQAGNLSMLSSVLKPDASEKETIGKIAAQAVENVRSRDEEAKKQKKANHHLSRRNKLTKVREHNESVLRASALASTSQGLGEVIGEDLEGWACSQDRHKKQKQSLSSLLKKKPTPKDRLAQKLLSAKVTNATIRQLTRDEDANYRDSFPNQW